MKVEGARADSLLVFLPNYHFIKDPLTILNRGSSTALWHLVFHLDPTWLFFYNTSQQLINMPARCIYALYEGTRTWTFCLNTVIPAPRRTLLGTQQALCAMHCNKACVTQETKGLSCGIKHMSPTSSSQGTLTH